LNRPARRFKVCVCTTRRSWSRRRGGKHPPPTPSGQCRCDASLTWQSSQAHRDHFFAALQPRKIPSPLASPVATESCACTKANKPARESVLSSTDTVINVKGRWTTFGNLGRMKLVARALMRSSKTIRCSASCEADERRKLLAKVQLT
jgi:hypothetical protein